MTKQEIYNYYKSDLPAFSQRFFPHHIEKQYGVPDFHREIYSLIQQGHRHNCILAPRNHSKSTIITLVYALHEILFQQVRYVLIISETQDMAAEFVETIKQELEDNELIHKFFGQLRAHKVYDGTGISKWTSKEIVTSTGVRIKGRGTGQAIRGSKIGRSRPDLILADDIESETNTATTDRRKKIKDWWDRAVLPSLDLMRGRIVAIGTLVHRNSLLKELYDSSTWHTLFYEAEDGNMQNLLWPERFGEKLPEIKADYKARGKMRNYNQEYRNLPISVDDQLFDPEDWRYYSGKYSNGVLRIKRGDSLEEITVYTFAGVDPAVSLSSDADYTVILTVAVAADGRIFVLPYQQGRWKPDQIIDRFFENYTKYKPIRSKIESTAFQKWLVHGINNEKRKRNLYPAIMAGVPHTAKNLRIANLQPRQKAHELYITEDMTELLHEATEWEPDRESDHEDILDALEKAVSVSFPPPASLDLRKTEQERQEQKSEKLSWAVI